MPSRWEHTEAPRGDEYDERWRALAASGQAIHGEADLVEALIDQHGAPRSVLDAGCGTGRVAIELAARGFDTVGVDLDPSMLDAAQAKAAHLQWHLADLAGLAGLDLSRRFGAVVFAGNVMIFVTPGSEEDVLRGAASQLATRGIVVAGFQVRSDRLPLDRYDAHATASGLELVARYATWDRAPYRGGDYAVSVHAPWTDV